MTTLEDDDLTRRFHGQPGQTPPVRLDTGDADDTDTTDADSTDATDADTTDATDADTTDSSDR